MVDGVLPAIPGARVGRRTATVLCDGALGALEVELLVQDNAAGSAI